MSSSSTVGKRICNAVKHTTQLKERGRLAMTAVKGRTKVYTKIRTQILQHTIPLLDKINHTKINNSK